MPSSSSHVRRNFCVLLTVICLTSVLAASLYFFGGRKQAATTTSAPAESQPANHAQQVKAAYGKLPLSFEANEGQTDAQVKFISRGQGYSLFLTPTEAVFSLKESSQRQESENTAAAKLQAAENPSGRSITTAIVRMKLAGANLAAHVTGQEQLPGKSNYFLGKDKSNWRTNVPAYQKVKYEDVYPGIDLVYYGNQRQLEYDFVIAAGADPRAIGLDFSGVEDIKIDERGELILAVAGGREIRQHKPIAYQEIGGARREIASRYVIGDHGRVHFDLGQYDTSQPLIIDPVLVYATYFGGTGNENAVGIAVNNAGEAYITGSTSSVNFPGSPVQGATPDLSDVFVVKVNAAGNGVVFASYFGGDNMDFAGGIAVDQNGDAYITGNTNSFNFPVAGSAYQGTKTGSNPLYKRVGGANYGSGVAGDAATGLTTANVSSIAVHPTDPSIVFATAYSGAPLYKSTDGGATWTASGAGIPDTFVNKVIFDRTRPGVMFLTGCSGSGLWSSGDGGNTWQLTSVQGACMNTVVSDQDGMIYAGGFDGKGLWKSADALSWTNTVIGDVEADGSADGFGFVVSNIAVDPTNGQIIYVGTDGGGVWKSYDRGMTWTQTALTQPGYVFDESMVIDPANPQTVYAVLAGQLYKTMDGGASWNGVGTPLQPGDFPTALMFSSGILHMGTTRSGMFTSIDGGAIWSPTSLTANNIHDIEVAPSDATQVYVGALTGSDGFITKLASDGSSLIYSTYLGGGLAGDQLTSDDNPLGIAVDAGGNAYVTGFTAAANFPTQSPTHSFAGFLSAFVTKLNSSGSNLLFSTPIGRPLTTSIGRGIAVAPNGSFYVGGNTNASDFPVVNASQLAYGGGANDGFLIKFDPSGGAYATSFSTYIGGPNNDQVRAVATDANSNAYVAGQTNSSSNLSTPGVVQPARGGLNDAFAGKYATNGTRTFLTYLGGTNQDFATGIAVDDVGSAYVSGYTNSADFPIAFSILPYGGNNDPFIVRLHPTGSMRVFSSYLGGANHDQAFDVAVDPSGGIYVTGTTFSTEARPSTIQSTNAGGSDAFIVKLAPANDLSVTMTDSPDPASVNNNLTYTVTLTNSGEGTLTGINLNDSPPANTTFVSATASQGTCTGTSNISCNIGTLLASQSATVTLVVKPTQEGTLSNTASASASQTEFNPNNNSATQTTTVRVGMLFTVNTNSGGYDGACDAVNCTIRDAVHAANLNPGKDTILFNIADQFKTINLTGGIESISGAVIIDATSQPGYAGKPIVELNGAGAGFTSGFYVGVSDVLIKGFVINRFSDHGIWTNTNTTNIRIEGNYIGTNLNGDTALPITNSGIFLQGSGHRIGGTLAAERNVIGANGHHGIAMSGATNSAVEGNYINTDWTGNAGIAQGSGGGIVLSNGASGNTIGGATSAHRNVVSGGRNGITIANWGGISSNNNTIQGNYVGIKADDSIAPANRALPNGGQFTSPGVIIMGSNNNVIVGNVLSGNSGSGLGIGRGDQSNPVSSNGNIVRGNLIGTDPTGVFAVPNQQSGVAIGGGSSGNIIGGSTPAERNIIAGNRGPCTGGACGDGINFSNYDGAANNNTVIGNYIGLNINGDALANTGNGIGLYGVTGNIIGGTSPAERNVISGNGAQGISLAAGRYRNDLNQPLEPAASNVIRGNFIGTNPTGTAARPNTFNGIALSSSSQNTIGGTTGTTPGGACSGACNLISGNTGVGIYFGNGGAASPAGSNNNTVRGNYIGTNLAGTAALPNMNNGMGLYNGSSNNLIGGDDDDDGAADNIVRARNVISGNANDGVNIGNFNGAASNNIFQGNYIGTNSAGTAPVPNGFQGMGVYGVDGTRIGGTSAGAGNLISGNGHGGIVLGSASPGQNLPQVGTTNTEIYGNFIGTNFNGTAIIRNTFSGVSMWGGASGNRVGGTAPGMRNLITGNGGNGVDIGSFNGAANGNTVEGNYIGTDVTGMTALSAVVNGQPFYGNGSGVGINGASNNTVGGTAAAARNVISGNQCQGVPIYNALVSNVVLPASNNTVQGNYIGLNKDGAALVTDPSGGPSFGNKCSGVFMGGATNNLIGGTAPGAGNHIAGSQHQGVVVGNNNGIIGSGNTIQGNVIGTNVGRTTPLPNGAGVLLFQGSSNNQIGGDDDDDGALDGTVRAGNLIVGSLGDGISIQTNAVGAVATGNKVQGNTIGGSALLKNGNNGINLLGAVNNVIGGTSAGAGNTISFNNNNGIVLNCPSFNGTVICSVGNVIRQNSIFSHQNNLGIRFNSNGANFGNNNQPAPTINFVLASGGTIVQGSLATGVPNQSYTLEFFSNDVCSALGQGGEGKNYIGTHDVTTDATGTAVFTTPVLGAAAVGKVVTATATHPVNGTSRFSFCSTVSPAASNITGRVTDAGVAMSGVTVTLSGGQSATTTTDVNGNYSFMNLPSDASYSVSASLAGHNFSPLSWDFDKLRGNQLANFTKRRVQYTITDLGTLGGANSFGIGINESGHVVGRSLTPTNTTRGFLYSGSLPLIDLGTFGGNNSDVRAINDAGKVVGDANTATGTNRAFVYFNGTKTDLGTFGGNSFGRGINNAGQVAGYAETSTPGSGTFRAFRTAPNALLSPSDNLGTLPGGAFSQGLGINEAGHVVGISGITGGFSRAFLHNGTAMVNLGTLGGNNSLAFYINDADMVVGRSEFALGNTATRAALYHNGSVIDLGTLGGINSSANAINNSNVIVGHSEFNPGNQLPFIQAFIYKDGVMVNLNARIPANAGWNLTTAQSINDAGQIAGYGVINGQTHAFLLTPVTETRTEQTITFNPLSNKTYGNAPFTLSASASSGLPVTFSIVSGPATINGNTLTITGAGVVTVRATQAGDDTYAEATADQAFTVAPALLKVIADSKTKFYGAPNPQLTVHYVGFVNNDSPSVLGGTLSLNTSANDTSAVGTYNITPSGLTSTNYTIQFLGAVLSIEKASTTAASANYDLDIPGAVNLVAHVSADAPSMQPVNGGAVTFVVRQGATNVATLPPAAVTNGQATASFNVVTAGAYTVYVSYSGDGNFYGSTGLASLTVGNANPVPTITGVAPDSRVKETTATGQFTLIIDGNGFMSTAGGFPANSSVDWFDRTTGQHTPLAVTSITETQIQATVPFTLIRAGKTVEVSVVNAGPGGGTSNAQPFFITDTTATVTSAETVIPDPLTGTASASSVDSTGAVLTAEASSGGTSGAGTLTLAQYSADPIGTSASPDVAAFSTLDTGGYFDVYVAPGSSFTQLSLDYCNTGGTTLYWWNGTTWSLVSNQSFSPVTQCITVTVTDTSSPSIAQLTGTIFGVASGPAVSQITVNPSTSLAVGNANIALNASFTDAGAPEGATYTAEVNWGDGQTNTCGLGTQPCAVNNSSVTGTHTYAAAGVYVIKVKVTRNQDGSFGSSLYESVVVYSPTGAVTGGGWFNSPVGAYTRNPSYTDRVHFNVNASYALGASSPTGMVDVRLPGLDLRATGLRWLSVTGNRAQLGGMGTLNGSGGYSFLITGTDGKLGATKVSDKVRIKVWKTATGEIIYDNQMETADAASPVIALGGGSINVKK